MTSTAAVPAPESVERPRVTLGSLWPLLTAVLACVVVYAPVVRKLMHDWWVLPDFSHGFFVPVFAAYVVWQQREELAAIKLRPSWTGLPILLLAMSMLIAGQLGAELFVSRVSLLIAVVAITVLLAGWKMFRAVFFPWLFLFFMIPIPALLFNQITFPLQLLASNAAATILPLFNVPVLREGNIINIPAMPLEVAEACSGIRSLMTLSTLAIMYSYLTENVRWRRVVLIVASIPIAVAANATRVVATGMCVQYWDPEKALGLFHEFSGWAIFMVALTLLYLLHQALRTFGRERA